MKELTVIDERIVLEKKFRVYGTKENPLFLAKDVAEWIDYAYKNKEKGTRNVNMMLNSIDEDEKMLMPMEYMSGNNLATTSKARKTQEMWFLTEDGLYEVLMQSRKPIAKEFKKQVKSILKQIRNTGGYVANDDMFLDTYLPFADETTRMLFKNTLETVRNQNEIISKQKRVIERQEFEIEHKEDVIIGLCKDISLKDKRQRISDIVRFNAKGRYAERYALLYKEFDNKFHVDSKRRLNNAKERNEVRKNMNRMEYICEESGLNMTNELYEITCKLFENDFNELLKVWENTIV